MKIMGQVGKTRVNLKIAMGIQKKNLNSFGIEQRFNIYPMIFIRQMGSFKPTTHMKKYHTNVIARKWVLMTNEQWAKKDGRIGNIVAILSCCDSNRVVMVRHDPPDTKQNLGESFFHGLLKTRMQYQKEPQETYVDYGRWTLNTQQRLVHVANIASITHRGMVLKLQRVGNIKINVRKLNLG